MKIFFLNDKGLCDPRNFHSSAWAEMNPA